MHLSIHWFIRGLAASAFCWGLALLDAVDVHALSGFLFILGWLVIAPLCYGAGLSYALKDRAKNTTLGTCLNVFGLLCWTAWVVAVLW
jgi:hypothetical protein